MEKIEISTSSPLVIEAGWDLYNELDLLISLCNCGIEFDSSAYFGAIAIVITKLMKFAFYLWYGQRPLNWRKP